MEARSLPFEQCLRHSTNQGGRVIQGTANQCRSFVSLDLMGRSQDGSQLVVIARLAEALRQSRYGILSSELAQQANDGHPRLRQRVLQSQYELLLVRKVEMRAKIGVAVRAPYIVLGHLAPAVGAEPCQSHGT